MSVPSEEHVGGDGSESDLREWERERLAKVERLRATGHRAIRPLVRRPYPSGRDRSQARRLWRPGETAEGSSCRVAGRVMARRVHGKAVFFTLRDGWDDLQVYSNIDTLGEESLEELKDVDLGDIIGCEGPVFRTRRGELTVHAESWTLLTKSLRPLPEKWHGLQDRETRYRQRYVDLISNPEVAAQLRGRGKLVSAMRRYLEAQGFVEVETPTLQPLAGGALAGRLSLITTRSTPISTCASPPSSTSSGCWWAGSTASSRSARASATRASRWCTIPSSP